MNAPAPGDPPVPPVRVAVVGGADATGEEYEAARALGLALARAGAVVVSGGRGGVMEAASRGAASAGGLTVGILPGPHASEANSWVLLPLATGMGEARNAWVVRAAEAVVAVGGGWGTLSEVALARKMGIPVAVLLRAPSPGLELPTFREASAAAGWAMDQARTGRGEISPPK